MSAQRTDTGFIFNAAKVSCLFEHKGESTIEIDTPRERMILRVTPSGLIRAVGKTTKQKTK